ncbi:hypothetical protein B0H13DRAFT_1721188 [Mycena leptocephala]|nr:hypothetical protein B0H13DRAFT_1721188 [Mycena leptocephala]
MISNQSLRDRLAEIDAQIALLEAERKIIQEQLGVVTYPVLSLPFDITSEIFVQCLPPVSNSEPIFHFPQKLPAALLLSQICRTWRDIAFKTPRIWAQFSISSFNWPKDHALGPRRVTEWVERAGSAPLSFILDRYESGWTPSPPTPAVHLPLFPFSAQWRNVDLRLPYADVSGDEFHSALFRKLPNLHTLAIKTEMGVIPGDPVISAFQHAPSLRAAFLVNTPPAQILLPWAQLTQFTGHWFEGTDCLHVLRAAPSLVECTFTTSGREGIPIKTALLPPHRHLEILSLTRGTVCLDLLCTLTLPALKELEFNNSGDGYRNEPELHAPFIEFLARSRPSLRRLSMVHAYQRLVHCFPFLHALTTLEMADLAGDDLPNLLHALMASHETSEVVLPNLRTLVVSLLESHRGTPSIVDYGR